MREARILNQDRRLSLVLRLGIGNFLHIAHPNDLSGSSLDPEEAVASALKRLLAGHRAFNLFGLHGEPWPP